MYRENSKKQTSVRWKNLLDVIPSPHATLQWLPWNALYGCPIYDSLLQASPPKKAVGNSIHSRVTLTLIPRLASPFKIFALLSTHTLSTPPTREEWIRLTCKLSHLNKVEGASQAGETVGVQAPHLWETAEFDLPSPAVRRTQLSRIIMPSSEIKSMNSANAQWLIKRWWFDHVAEWGLLWFWWLYKVPISGVLGLSI